MTVDDCYHAEPMTIYVEPMTIYHAGLLELQV